MGKIYFKRALRLLAGIGLLGALTLSAAQEPEAADPPGRVARLNHASGTVTFSPAGSDAWSPAHVNRPLVSGDRIWVEQGARSELHIGSTAVRLGGMTSMGFLRFDDDVAQLKLTQGTLSLRVRALEQGESLEVATPNLALSVREPGSYRIDVAPDGGMTTVTVRQGSATAYGDGVSTALSEHQQVSFAGAGLDIADSGYEPGFDAFDQWVASRDRAEDASATARYVSRDVIGYEQLDAYGSWHETPQYGMVWTPRRVDPGWAPYRSGHWSWIAPWGWTWIDDAPWGFAPYHYGRWAYVGQRWCWVPGRTLAVARPVYAPALVVFIGGSHSQFSLTVGGGAPGVGWLPLAPGEMYRPGYRSSPTYIRNVNRTVIVNQTTIVNQNAYQTSYRNRHAPHAITAIPASVFARGGAVRPVANTVRPEQVDRHRYIGGAPVVPPSPAAIAGPARAPVPVAVRRTFERQVITGTGRDGRAFMNDGDRHDARRRETDVNRPQATVVPRPAPRPEPQMQPATPAPVRGTEHGDAPRWRREVQPPARGDERRPTYGGRPDVTVGTTNDRQGEGRADRHGGGHEPKPAQPARAPAPEPAHRSSAPQQPQPMQAQPAPHEHKDGEPQRKGRHEQERDRGNDGRRAAF